jgi:hypothetical protein
VKDAEYSDSNIPLKIPTVQKSAGGSGKLWGEENAFHLIAEQSASIEAIPMMPRATSSHWPVKFNRLRYHYL